MAISNRCLRKEANRALAKATILAKERESLVSEAEIVEHWAAEDEEADQYMRDEVDAAWAKADVAEEAEEKAWALYDVAEARVEPLSPKD